MTERELKGLETIAFLAGAGAVVVEVGSLFGRSSWAWSRTVHPNAEVHCIDLWERSSGVRPLEEQYGVVFGLDQFQKYLSDCPNVNTHKGMSPGDFKEWDKKIDVYFDDSDHQDPGLSENLFFWSQFVKEDGVICGHDYHPAKFPDVVRHASRLAQQRKMALFTVESFWCLLRLDKPEMNRAAARLLDMGGSIRYLPPGQGINRLSLVSLHGHGVVLVGTDAPNAKLGDELDSKIFPCDDFLRILSQLPPGSRVFDVGANIGVFSLIAARLGHKVEAFEASSNNAALLLKNLEINAVENVLLHQIAVSSQRGKMKFFSQGPYGHLVEDDSEGREVEQVQAAPLDDFVATGEPVPTLIKMDVEGGETQALEGAVSMLSSSTPPDIYIESNTKTLRENGLTPPDLLGQLAKYGYRFFYMEADDVYEALVDDMQHMAIMDYYCTRYPAPWILDNFKGRMPLTEKLARLTFEKNTKHPARIAHYESMKEQFPAYFKDLELPFIPPDVDVFFRKGENCGHLVGTGWSVCEADRLWSAAINAELLLNISALEDSLLAKGICIYIDLIPFVFKDSKPQQHVIVCVNDQMLYDASLSVPNTLALNVDRNLCQRENPIRISLHLPGAARPIDFGLNDKRLLGVALRRIRYTVRSPHDTPSK